MHAILVTYEEAIVDIFPAPPDEAAGHVFRAARLWQFNVCGVAVVAIGGSFLSLAIAASLMLAHHGVTWLALVLILDVAIGLPLFFPPGRLLLKAPYAAQIEMDRGIIFYAPLSRLYIPFEDIRQIRWSYLRMGWAVQLKKRHGVVRNLVIHAAWGRSGRELIREIELKLTEISKYSEGH
jgi:hypothetical protein